MKITVLKKLFLGLIILSCFCACECYAKKPYLTFNANPITTKTVYDAQEVFRPGQTINYALFMPKGFKQEFLRLQIAKIPENIPYGGVTIYMSKDLFIDKTKNFYIDKFVIRQEGKYAVRFFYGNKVNKPFAENVLWVRD